MIREYFRLAWTSITHRKVRSYLTIIGIFIGIAAVVSLVALGNGLNEAINEQLQTLGGDTLFITPKSLLGPGIDAPNPLTDNDLRAVGSVRGVIDVGPYRYRTASLEYEDEQIYYYVASIPEDDSRDFIIDAFQIEVLDGRMLRPGESGKAVLASDFFYKDIFEKDVRVGKDIIINGKPFEIVGLVRTSDEESGIDRWALLNYGAYKDTFEEAENIEMAAVRIDDPEDLARAEEDIERALRRQRNVQEGEEDFDVQTPEDLFSAFSAIFDLVTAVLVGIAGISLLVGGIGIMNTMYTSVVERTKEIGIMKSVGATNNQILALFLVESGVLGLLGGGVGVAVGILIGKAVEFIGTAALGGSLIRAIFPADLILGALFFSFIVGALSGALPAWQASKMKPVDALRFK